MKSVPQEGSRRASLSSRSSKDPSLRHERRLLRSYDTLIAIDECGRGALSGPVCCGAVLLDASTGGYPSGLRDSKILSPRRREELVLPVKEWARSSSIGTASASEIDRFGIVAALRLAALRAVASMELGGSALGVVLLDGPQDWFSPESSVVDHSFVALTNIRSGVPPVVTKVRGDRECASLAAASVIAKVARDALMNDLDLRYPGYGWSENKGYASPAHVEGLRRLGVSPQHRVSWRLPGV
jgi:ribonuclease HII